MRIFYELTHTACDCAIMRNEHKYDVLHPTWDESGRRKPSNVKLVNAPTGIYDLAIVGFERGFSLMRNQRVPIIWKSMVDFNEWPQPRQDIMSRISAWVALCEEGVTRYSLAGHPKASYIVPGIDSDVLGGYVGSLSRVLSVGNLLPVRKEKGPDVLASVAQKIPLDIVGLQNEGIKGATILPAASSFEHLAELYKQYRVYLNPCGVICCSVLEAMATGMPVVTLTPGNFIGLMRHRENCFIAENWETALHYLELCLKNEGLARDVGRQARKSVENEFHPVLVGHRWDRLIRRVVQDYKVGR